MCGYIGKPLRIRCNSSFDPTLKVITLSTDKGIVELAASPASQALLAERCLGDG
jgi:hypothetical protein